MSKSFVCKRATLFELTLLCRAAEAGKDARASFSDAADSVRDPENWNAGHKPGVWDKVKATVTGTPATPAEAAQRAASDALDASQKTADDAINSAHKVVHNL